MSGDDLWRVRIAPGEEKVLTLDQVDDLFRLEIIDRNTLLWQEGMDQWLPLRVVAGLDDAEAPEQARAATEPPAPTGLAAAPAASAPPPPGGLALPASRLPPPPPSALRPPTPSQMALAVAAAPVRRDTLMPGWTAAPGGPPSTGSAPPKPEAPSAALPPVGSALPPLSNPPLAPLASPRPLASAPPPVRSAPPPLSNPAPPPLDVSPALFPHAAPVVVERPAAPTRGSRMEWVLIAVAALLGLLLTLYRNGVVHDANLDTALGGPGFGTPGAVQALVSKTSPQK